MHRAVVDINQPDVIKKGELKKCIRFFENLAKVTDNALEKYNSGNV
nr:hypothetical protein [Parashewanella hymeniacidonis]